MTFRSLLPLVAVASLGAAAPALAWTGTSQTGDYRFTATILPAGQTGLKSLSLAIARQGGASAQAMTLSAWFIDSEGMILGPASLDGTRANGVTLVAQDKSLRIPARASALVVLAQPSVRTASSASTPAMVSQITLPEGLAPAGA